MSKKKWIVAGAAGVITVMTILISVLNQSKWVTLIECENSITASEVAALLDADNISRKVSDDGLRVRIKKENLAKASLLLGANDIQSSAYYIDNISGDFSTTEADKQRRYKVYLENTLADDITASMETVKAAKVILDLPEQDGTQEAAEKEPSAWIMLELQGECDAQNISALAKAISVGLGCETPQNITIMDIQGNILFAGNDI